MRGRLRARVRVRVRVRVRARVCAHVCVRGRVCVRVCGLVVVIARDRVVVLARALAFALALALSSPNIAFIALENLLKPTSRSFFLVSNSLVLNVLIMSSEFVSFKIASQSSLNREGTSLFLDFKRTNSLKVSKSS